MVLGVVHRAADGQGCISSPVHGLGWCRVSEPEAALVVPPRWCAVTSAASAGGAAGASGVGLQNRVFGWAAVAMVAEQPLPAANLVAGAVVRVGAQTGFYVDDVAAQTDADNYVLFQVKAGMSLGKAERSPLAEALGAGRRAVPERPAASR